MQTILLVDYERDSHPTTIVQGRRRVLRTTCSVEFSYCTDRFIRFNHKSCAVDCRGSVSDGAQKQEVQVKAGHPEAEA